MEKVQLVLQLLHPYTFIPTSTVIREMRVPLRAIQNHTFSNETPCKKVPYIIINNPFSLIFFLLLLSKSSTFYNNTCATKTRRPFVIITLESRYLQNNIFKTAGLLCYYCEGILTCQESKVGALKYSFGGPQKFEKKYSFM